MDISRYIYNTPFHIYNGICIKWVRSMPIVYQTNITLGSNILNRFLIWIFQQTYSMICVVRCGTKPSRFNNLH